MDKRRALDELRGNPKNVRFQRLCMIAGAFGFEFKRLRGSHHIYARKGIPEILNFQNVGGRAKPYQVRQFIKIIDRHDLVKEP